MDSGWQESKHDKGLIHTAEEVDIGVEHNYPRYILARLEMEGLLLAASNCDNRITILMMTTYFS